MIFSTFCWEGRFGGSVTYCFAQDVATFSSGLLLLRLLFLLLHCHRVAVTLRASDVATLCWVLLLRHLFFLLLRRPRVATGRDCKEHPDIKKNDVSISMAFGQRIEKKHKKQQRFWRT